MKKIYGFLGAAALLGLASCSNEGVESPSNPSKPGSGDYAYAQVRIQMGHMAGTRADNIGDLNQDFNEGTVKESEVNDVLLVFYNNAGAIVGTGTFSPENQGSASDSSPMLSNTVEVAVELADNASAADATQVVAYVNFGGANNLQSMVNKISLAEAKAVVFNADYTDYSSMPMTNSGYYNGDNYILATDCTGCVYEIDPATKQPIGGTPTTVDIYVDRLPAKVELAAIDMQYVSEQTLYQATANGDVEVTMSFTPTFWGVTGLAQSTYALKSMSGISIDSWMKLGSDNMRNYWAVSPFYNDETLSFPESPVVSEGSEYTFEYLTLGDTKTANITNAEGTWNFGNPQYVLENTLPANAISAESVYNPAVAVASIVLAGEWAASNDPEGQKYAEGFYLRKNNINGNTYIYDAEEAETMLLAIAAQNISVSTGAEGEKTPISKNDVEFVRISGKASNAWYIQIDEDTDTNAGKTFYRNTSGEPVEFETVADVNTYLSTYVGSVTSYILSKAAFLVPLKHYFDGTYTTSNEFPETIATGNYGLVRNNWYQLTINSISTLGAGFGSEDDIIVPQPEEEDQLFGLSATLNVLQWHMRNQSVDL